MRARASSTSEILVAAPEASAAAHARSVGASAQEEETRAGEGLGAVAFIKQIPESRIVHSVAPISGDIRFSTTPVSYAANVAVCPRSLKSHASAAHEKPPQRHPSGAVTF